MIFFTIFWRLQRFFEFTASVGGFYIFSHVKEHTSQTSSYFLRSVSRFLPKNLTESKVFHFSFWQSQKCESIGNILERSETRSKATAAGIPTGSISHDPQCEVARIFVWFVVIFTLPCHCETSKSIFRSGKKKYISEVRISQLFRWSDVESWRHARFFRCLYAYSCALHDGNVCVALKWENMNSKFWLW